MSVPGSLGADGLPIGVQLLAPPHRDRELLAGARWVEQALRARRGRAGARQSS